MKSDENTKNAVRKLAEAVQSSVEASPMVKSAVENLELMGYIPNFTVQMDVELQPRPLGLTDTRVRFA